MKFLGVLHEMSGDSYHITLVPDSSGNLDRYYLTTDSILGQINKETGKKEIGNLCNICPKRASLL